MSVFNRMLVTGLPAVPKPIVGRVASRYVAGEDLADAIRVVRTLKGTPPRGRQMFESVGCIKCHTLDRHDDPKGPFLGDAGGRFDTKHIVESVMRPSAKIAQGFATENITVKGPTEYTGFVTRETTIVTAKQISQAHQARQKFPAMAL